jgi:hypothetical protein
MLALAPAWDWPRLRLLVLAAVSSLHSKRAYALALDQWFAWARQSAPEGFTKATVQRYRAHVEAASLAAATVNLRLSAVRRLAAEAADNRLLAPEAALEIARVKGTPRCGARLGNWLTREQASELLAASAAESLRALRDRALLCVLVGCGLRRSEAAALEVAQAREAAGCWPTSGASAAVSAPRPCRPGRKLPSISGPPRRDSGGETVPGGEGRSRRRAENYRADGVPGRGAVRERHGRAFPAPRPAAHPRQTGLRRQPPGADPAGVGSIATTERYLGGKLNLAES